MTGFAFLILIIAAIAGYVLNRQAATAIRNGGARMHSLSFFHGMFALLVVAVPVLVLLLVWLVLQGAVIDRLTMAGLPEGTLEGLDTGAVQLILAEIKSISGGRIFGTPEEWKIAAAERYVWLHQAAAILMVITVLVLSAGLILFSRRTVAAGFRARHGVERIVSGLMIFCSLVAIFTTVGIIAALVFETAKFFSMVSVSEFLFGLNWEPQIPIREDQIAAEGAFGAVPVFLGTIVIASVALLVAVPTGLLTAIYLNEFAPKRFRTVVKPILEILAGVPTVVYGFFAILVVAPALRSFGRSRRGTQHRARRRRGHGDHAHPLHLVLRRRRAFGGAPEPARRRARAWGDPGRNHAERALPRRDPGHRRGGPAGGEPGHRRDDDRRHGRRPDRADDDQPSRQRHRGNGADRHAADRRYGIRQPQDARRLRARDGSFPRDPGDQRVRPADRPQIP